MHCHVVVVKVAAVKLSLCVQCHEIVKSCDDIGIKAGLMVALHQNCFWDYTADWDDDKRQQVIDRFTDVTIKYRVDDRAALDADLAQQLNLARYALREAKHRAYVSRERARKRRLVVPVDAIFLQQRAVVRAALRVQRHAAYRERERLRKSRDLRRNHH
jgi:hypothetical protein